MSSLHERATLISPRSGRPDPLEPRENGWLTLEAYVAWLAETSGTSELAIPRTVPPAPPPPPEEVPPSSRAPARRARRAGSRRARRIRSSEYRGASPEDFEMMAASSGT